jgi:RimJ/RimL family protein N-acetyltransferase
LQIAQRLLAEGRTGHQRRGWVSPLTPGRTQRAAWRSEEKGYAVRDPSAVATELTIPELAGERCSLRRWEFSDIQSLRPACGDPDIGRFTTVPRTFDPVSARAWIARQHAHAHAGDAIVLAIVPRHDDSPVGMVGLFGLDRKAATARLGYWVIADHRRRGFAACATQLLVGWAFTEQGLTRIHIDRELHNRASEHVAAKLGAAVSGSRTVSLDGEPVELVRHTLS